LVHVDPRDGDPGRGVERLIPIAGIDYEFRRHGQTLFIDTDGRLKMWGRPTKRTGLIELLSGRGEEMKRFLIARALRGSV
jgi:hypothetical protein